MFVILIYTTPKMAQNPQAAAAAPAAAAAAPAAPALAPGQFLAPRQAPLARPVVVPPTFGGASQDDWHCFIARFDAACVVNGYLDAEMMQFLPCCFKESAFTTYQTILAAHPQYTYVEMCTELGLRFEPPQQSRLLEAGFRARLKRSTESQAEFAAALQRLAARAFPGQQGPLLDRLTLNQFIDGQVNSDLRLHIRTSSPAALDAAVRRAYEVAAILEVENRRGPPGSHTSLRCPDRLYASGSGTLRRSTRGSDSYVQCHRGPRSSEFDFELHRPARTIVVEQNFGPAR